MIVTALVFITIHVATLVEIFISPYAAICCLTSLHFICRTLLNIFHRTSLLQQTPSLFVYLRIPVSPCVSKGSFAEYYFTVISILAL